MGHIGLVYGAAALAEIAGCFAFWSWLRSGRSAWVLVPGVASLILFAWLLTRVESPVAGRAFAAYGGVYIVAPRSHGSGRSRACAPIVRTS